MRTYYGYIIECTVQVWSNLRHFLMWLPSSAIRNRLVDGCTLAKPVVMVQKKHNQHILTAKTPHVDRQARCRLGVALLGAGQPEEPSFWRWILAPHPQYIKLYVLHSYRFISIVGKWSTTAAWGCQGRVVVVMVTGTADEIFHHGLRFRVLECMVDAQWCTQLACTCQSLKPIYVECI